MQTLSEFNILHSALAIDDVHEKGRLDPKRPLHFQESAV
jgi:hypothetical protein